jgi:tRNA-uridine 2-sulfurtransferase
MTVIKNTENTNKKVAVGLSGGVDSSVAAHLLLEQGYEVTGVFMQCWDAKADGCRAEEDRADAVAIATKLGIKFVALDFVTEYKAKVIEYFYKEYEAGRTPNPDVMCNREIKFGMFLEWAMKEGFDFVATGHYARVIGNAKYKLLKGVDDTKDQSYFLYVLGQHELSKTLLPIGDLKKSDVRKIAEKQGLHTYKKPDSVGICFIGEVDIKEFLKKRIPANEGDVVNKDGRVLGTHEGVAYYTIGQRHGFNVTEYVGLPLYVVGKDVEKNELIVGFAGEALKDEFDVGQLTWIAETVPESLIAGNALECDIRVRHLGELHSGNISINNNGVKAKVANPIFGIAPGQSAVFYVGEELIGGGIIL